MAKKRYKKKNKISLWIAMILGLLATIGIGGLFINGTFLNTVILGMLPEIVHTLVGWGFVAGGIVSFVLSLLKK